MIHLDGMVDNQIGGEQRIGKLRIGAERATAPLPAFSSASNR
jgi:hypothetical protein